MIRRFCTVFAHPPAVIAAAVLSFLVGMPTAYAQEAAGPERPAIGLPAPLSDLDQSEQMERAELPGSSLATAVQSGGLLSADFGFKPGSHRLSAISPTALSFPAPGKPVPVTKATGPAKSLGADKQAALRVIAFLEAGQFDKADTLTKTLAGNPVLRDYLDWEMYRRQGTGASFTEIAEFIDAHPDWPRLEVLQRRAEEAIAGNEPPAKLKAWFDVHPPITGSAMVRYADALDAAGRKGDALQLYRQAWIFGNFIPREEADLLVQHGGAFDFAINYQRADRLLFEANLQADAVRRVLPLLDPGHRAVAEARLALRLNAAGADKMVAHVPKANLSDPGLSYERMRFRQRQGNDKIDDIPLAGAPKDPAGGEKVWAMRQVKARAALTEGRVSDAYKLVSDLQGLPPNAAAEAEFLAGWIALRLLDQPREALRHFVRLDAAVRFPVSKARAAYWLGRTYEVANDKARTHEWYERAAQFPTTYYGQLALLKLDRRGVLELPPQPKPTAAMIQAFDLRQLVQATRLVDQLGQDDRLRTFVLRLQETSPTAEEKSLVADLATKLGRPDVALAAAKRAFQSGTLVIDANFPLVDPLTRDFGLDSALVLAVSRQESEFNAGAVSPAGAMGLMQLMPATAKAVAKSAGLTYTPAKLTTDPAFNATLGSRYLKGLLNQWDGNLVLALASYNAGEGRARKWIKDWGDPRQPKVDVIDWVELIPFTETRNYVQRVTEGVQVYRQLLAQTDPKRNGVALALDADLRGRDKWKSCDNC